MLVSGWTGALNSDLDTNDDGVLDVMPWTAIIDCVGLTNGAAPELRRRHRVLVLRHRRRSGRHVRSGPRVPVLGRLADRSVRPVGRFMDTPGTGNDCTVGVGDAELVERQEALRLIPRDRSRPPSAAGRGRPICFSSKSEVGGSLRSGGGATRRARRGSRDRVCHSRSSNPQPSSRGADARPVELGADLGPHLVPALRIAARGRSPADARPGRDADTSRISIQFWSRS